MNNMHMGLFVVAMALSAVSAYYSILGLAAIFSASWWSVVILASILEVSKLVLASWLYRNWPEINFLIRTYLTMAVITLMVITSVGTFGFLSQAHAQQDAQAAQTQLQLSHIQNQTEAKQAELAQFSQTLAQLDRSINIQLDANRAQGALNARRQQQTERAQLQGRIASIQAEIQQLNNQKLSLNQVQIAQETKLGPIRYVMAIVNPDADASLAIKWLILVLVMVCDPLAVLMVMASSVRKSSDHMVPIPPGSTRYCTDGWQVYTGSEWEPIQTPPQSPVPDHVNPAQPSDLKPLAEIIDQVVTQVIQQRPIFEMGVRSSDTHHASAPSESVLHAQHLQKLIEQTLENWMNRTLTVTYTADQTEIDKIVEKVIARTSQAPGVSTQTAGSVNESELMSHVTPQIHPIMETANSHQHRELTNDPEAPNPPTTSPDTDHSASRPIYNYFGEERVRGGKKHNITT